MRPDLILAVYSEITQADFDTLSAIAPTVAPPSACIDCGVPWQELTRTVGMAVGRAEQLVGEVEDQMARARAAHPEFVGATAVMAGYEPGTYYGFGRQDLRGRLLSDLGFEVPAAIDELAGDASCNEISRERVDLLDTDVLVWLIESDDHPAEIAADPLYARLHVATQRRDVYLLDRSDLGGATTFQTVLSLPFLLDRLVPMLAAALDGDLTTEVPS